MEKILSKQEYWKTVLDDWLESGMTQRKYCDNKQVNFNNFAYWRRRLREEGADNDSALAVVEVMTQRSFPGIGEETMAQIIGTTGLTITIPGSAATVSIHGDLRLDQLARIVAACHEGAERDCHVPA